MNPTGIDHIQTLIDALHGGALSTAERVDALQEIRRLSASLYLNNPQPRASSECDQIDALALKACGLALNALES